jgi:hypothetical protein
VNGCPLNETQTIIKHFKGEWRENIGAISSGQKRFLSFGAHRINKKKALAHNNLVKSPVVFEPDNTNVTDVIAAFKRV